MPDIQLHYDCKHCPGEVEQDPSTFEWYHTRIEDGSHSAEPQATYHGITKAVCLNCGKVTTSVTDLEVMNDLDPTCECGVHDTLWSLQDGTRSITTGDGDSNTTWFDITEVPTGNEN